MSQFTVIAGRIGCRTFEPAKIRGTISEMRLGIQWPGEAKWDSALSDEYGQLLLSRPPDFKRIPRGRETSANGAPTGIGCCARAASGHAAAPPSAASNSRRPMVTVIRPSRAKVRKWNDTTPRACCPTHRRCGRSARRAYATGHRPAHDFCFSVAEDRARGSRTPRVAASIY